MDSWFDHLGENERARAALIGAIILFLFETGLQVSGVQSLPLAIVLWGIAVTLFLYWLSHLKWAAKLRPYLYRLFQSRLVRYASLALIATLIFWAGTEFESWWSARIISADGTKVQLGPRKRVSIPAAPIQTSLQILFGPESLPPKEIRSQNIEWQAIEQTESGFSPKYSWNGLAGNYNPDRLRCLTSQDLYDEKCFVKYSRKYLELVLSFEKPITFKKIKVSVMQGGDAPTWTQIIMTETDAVLRFTPYPTDKLLYIEAVDEGTNDSQK